MNYLGKVAKGVGGVLKAVEGVAVVRDDAISMEVDAVVHRISDSTMAEDKRSALDELRGMVQDNPKAQLAVGTKGLSILCTVLFDMREDVDMLRGTLEVLLAVFAVHENANGQQNQEAAAGAINSEIFAQKRENIAVVLSLLEDEPIGVDDFYVRYHSVQLLSCLINTGIFKLQEAVLGNPLGVARLIDLLKEREAIRNEVLLLLAALTKEKSEIQNIAAFEGAFDTLFGIIREEGGAGGSIVVLDCLLLVDNLIRENAQNQRLFRETGFVQQLLDQVKVSVEPGTETSVFGANGQIQGGTGNLKGMLETLSLIALPPNDSNDPSLVENYLANQAALASCGALTLLPKISLHQGGVPDAHVRAAAFRCLGFIILGNDNHRIHVQEAHVALNGENVHLTQAVLQIALSSIDSEECSSADYLLQSICWNNPAGQLQLLSSMQVGIPEPSFGSELVRGLATCAEGSPVGLRAARVLRYILEGDPNNKSQSLQLAIQVPNDDRQEYFLYWCVELLTFSLQSGSNWAIPAGLLRLLISWVDSSPLAVQALLEPQHQMSLLVGVLNGGMGVQEQVVISLTAFLLGACCVTAARMDAPGGAGYTGSAGQLHAFTRDLIVNSIGMQPFYNALDALSSTSAFLEIVNSQGPHSVQDGNPLDPEFVQYYHYLLPEIHGHITSDRPMADPEQTIAPPIPERNHAAQSDPGVLLGGTSPEMMYPQSVPSATTPRSEPYSLQPEHPPTMGTTNQFPTVTPTPDVPMYPPPRNQTPDSGFHASPRSQSQMTNGGVSEPEELRSLHLEVSRLREENGRLRLELDKSHAGARVAEADAAARQAAEMRAYKADEEIIALKAALKEELESHFNSKNLIARLERESNQFASQQESMVLEHQALCKQLEEHAKLLEDKVQDLEAQQLQVQGSDTAQLVYAAREEVQRETAESINDLLICLGLESEKSNCLARRLELLGEDVEKVLEGVSNVDDIGWKGLGKNKL